MISIVIPAYNESAVIRRCLDAITWDAQPGEMEVIVACNGCTDDTAAIASNYGEPVRVVETETASKIAALNLGDCEAKGFPRFYVDADVVLPMEVIRTVAEVLQRGEAMAASPRMTICNSQQSGWIRAYYEVWFRGPYHLSGMVGGVYALSEAGRQRFERFPEVIADDGYIRLLFQPHEQMMLKSHTFTIVPPSTLKSLVQVKVRSRLGEYELKRKFPELVAKDQKAWRPTWGKIVRQPELWLCLPVYLYVNVVSRLKARQQLRDLDNYKWERDETSRQLVR